VTPDPVPEGARAAGSCEALCVFARRRAARAAAVAVASGTQGCCTEVACHRREAAETERLRSRAQRRRRLWSADGWKGSWQGCCAGATRVRSCFALKCPRESHVLPSQAVDGRRDHRDSLSAEYTSCAAALTVFVQVGSSRRTTPEAGPNVESGLSVKDVPGRWARDPPGGGDSSSAVSARSSVVGYREVRGSREALGWPGRDVRTTVVSHRWRRNGAGRGRGGADHGAHTVRGWNAWRVAGRRRRACARRSRRP